MSKIFNVERRGERRRGHAPLSVALLLCLAAFSISSKALAAVYTQQITLPTPPSSQFAASGGGDGWDVALSSTQVFNVFHHQGQLTIACKNQADASLCWPTTSRTITDGSSNFASLSHASAVYDAPTNKLYVYATRVANTQGGVVCIDPVLAATSSNPFCGFTPLTEATEAPMPSGFSALSYPVKVGSKLYSFNYVTGSGPTGGRNRMLCFDLSTHAACTGQPYAVDLGGAGALNVPSYPSPATNLIGNQILVPLNNGVYRIACFDGSTQGPCTGSFPIASTAGAVSYGPVIPLLDGSSASQGFCLPDGSGTCYSLTGGSLPAPANFTSVLTYTQPWQGPAVTLGPRVYVANGSVDRVLCYDYSTSASCSGFPKAFSGLGYLYTVNRDPARPTCLWVNADYGAQQIQNFDAYSGGACNGIRVLAAQFVVPQDKCNPASYLSLKMLAPAPGSYTSATVSFNNGAGNPLPIPTKTLDATGKVDLTGLALNSATGLPQFLITLTGAAPTLGQVTLELTWESNYDPSCVGPGGVVSKTDTTITTSLSAAGSTGATLSVEAGTAVADTANIAGTNAPKASGSVTYTWYSDSACTKVASAGSAQVITTPGTVPASAPVTLAAGTYYPVVAYSGDAGNNPSSSTCGDEVLEVTGGVVVPPTPPSCALTNVIAGPPRQLQITVQSSSAGIATIEVTDSTNASVDVPAFSAGDKDALVVLATKVDQAVGSRVALRVTDVNGVVTDCDPEVPGQPSTVSITSNGSDSQGCSIGLNNPGAGLPGFAGALVGLALLLRRRRASR